LKLALPRPAVSEALEQFRPDLVHVVNPAVLGLGGIWLAKSRNLPLVASYHTHLPKYLEHYGMGMLEPLLWELLKAAHNQASLNLCTSTAMVSELAAKGIQHTALWQRGVDTDLFRPELRNESMRARLHGPYDDTGNLLLYIGRLSAEKQIERIRPVLEAMPQTRLALVGDGPHRHQLERCFEGTPTTFVGYLAGQDLASAYACGDAFLFPSSTETLGLVLLEAMAAGCPVVGADRGGIPDIVSDGENGCLYDPDQPHSLTTAVQRLQEGGGELLSREADSGGSRMQFAGTVARGLHEVRLPDPTRAMNHQGRHLAGPGRGQKNQNFRSRPERSRDPGLGLATCPRWKTGAGELRRTQIAQNSLF
jgi:glycosyltransferase involved in cell wall biosynthesis